MKNLIVLLLLLFATLAYPGVGDVYYCVTDHSAAIASGGVMKTPHETITLKWENDRIVFKSDGALKDSILFITDSNIEMETWSASGRHDVASFKNQRLAYASVIPVGEMSFGFVASCEIL